MRYCRRPVILLVALTAGPARSTDHFLLIGGGPTPEASQISLEHNIRFVYRLLTEQGAAAAKSVVLFGAGDPAALDVCFHRRAEPSQLTQLLADVFDYNAGLAVDYRRHDLPRVDGPNTRRAVLDRLDALAHELRAGDRAIIYVAAHGGPGEPAGNGVIFTWRREQLSVRDFTAALDRFPPKAEVVVVMVQCYCGGFANILFTGGDPEKGLAPHSRAGFFATTDNRPAAGCTADVKIEDYHEYSSYFFAALGGKDRLDRKTVGADLDHDGKVDFSEAHAYSLAHSETIDVSIRTSDRFLRKYSSINPADSHLTQPQAAYSPLIQSAAASERMVLESLTEKMQLSGEDRIARAKQLARENERERRGRQKKLRSVQAAAQRLRETIGNDVAARWPFLKSPFHPRTQKMLTGNDPAVLAAILDHPSYKEWSALRRREAELKTTDLDLERVWAKLQRIQYLAESVALANNLPLVASELLVSRYRSLVKLEQSSLGRTKSIVVSQLPGG